MDGSLFKRRHADAETRATLYSFLLDCWDGTGGFAPPLDEVISANLYGPEVDELPDWKGTSYIDRFSRESLTKWRNRVRRAHYTNIFRTIGETICGFLFRALPNRIGGDEATEAFLANADGRGTPWDDMLRHEIGRRLWTFGALPILVDRPVDDSDNLADRRPTYARVLNPSSLYDWETDDDGDLLWAKVVEIVTSCGSASDERETVWRATEWTREGWQRWTLTDGEDTVEDGGSGFHPCGVVPIVMGSMSRPIGASILGTSAAHEIGQEARKLYNYQSLLDEHLYGQVYAVLAVTLGELTQQETGGFKLGTDNALVLRGTGSSASFISPPQSVSDTLFKAINESVRRAFRAARLEFTLRESGQPESGVARQYEFAATDRGIKAMADECARIEYETQRLVCLWDGRDPDEALDEYRAEYPESYDVKDLDRELLNIQTALTLQLGATAEIALRKQARDDLITLRGEELDKSNEEIEEAAEIAGEADNAPPIPPIMPPPERPFGQEASQGMPPDGIPPKGDTAETPGV